MATPSSHRAAKSTTVNTRWVCFNDPTTFIQLAGTGSIKFDLSVKNESKKMILANFPMYKRQSPFINKEEVIDSHSNYF